MFGLGLLQVMLTIVDRHRRRAATCRRWLPAGWRMGWQTALALSGALAMSSTAIVVKLMSERLELETEHGKRVMGVLLFQDLAVVPLLVLIPALGQPAGDAAEGAGAGWLKAAVADRAAAVRRPARDALVAHAGARRRKSEELFMLNLLLVTLGLAWLTELAGLSLALGAFIAGMLISETEYKHQVETDIRPFHDVLLGLFFITHRHAARLAAGGRALGAWCWCC